MTKGGHGRTLFPPASAEIAATEIVVCPSSQPEGGTAGVPHTPLAQSPRAAPICNGPQRGQARPLYVRYTHFRSFPQPALPLEGEVGVDSLKGKPKYEDVGLRLHPMS